MNAGTHEGQLVSLLHLRHKTQTLLCPLNLCEGPKSAGADKRRKPIPGKVSSGLSLQLWP